MALSLYIATTPNVGLGAVTIQMESTHFYDNVPFGPPGTVLNRNYPIPTGQSFDLQAMLIIGNLRVGFRLTNIGEDDILTLAWLPNNAFIANVLHQGGGVGCAVTCLDTGQSSPNCITCTRGNISVRVCC
jgi:hypothetical protein